MPNENLARLSVHPRIISLDLSITEKNLSLKKISSKMDIYIDNKKKDLPYGKKENKKKISNKLERNCYTFKRKKKIKYCKKEYI